MVDSIYIDQGGKTYALTWGNSIINRDEAGESKAGPGHGKGPWGFKEEAEVGPICPEPPLFEDCFWCLSVLGRYSKWLTQFLNR